jgi:hypothetical protein
LRDGDEDAAAGRAVCRQHDRGHHINVLQLVYRMADYLPESLIAKSVG